MKDAKVLVIDNIDSFVYNLVQYVGVLGGNPVVLQNNAPMGEVDRTIAKEKITHIIISPGPKTPKEAGISNKIIEKYGKKIPTLGVCLGHQCIGYVFGGTIQRAKELRHGKTSLIEHNGMNIFRDIVSPFEATRYHSLIIDEKTLPDCLVVSARSLDDKEIMAVNHKKFPIYGVQFHPESILTKEGMTIVKNFLELRCK
jgi:anthranilate synthase/aminodeoxychorismate synthase-like glutamine amidotransferase